MKAIGLDIGTTSICGLLMDCESGEAERIVSRSNDAWIRSAQPWERIQKPAAIRDKVLEILEELAGPETGAVGITGQMHGILYLDAQGSPVSPLYTWQDGRGNLPCGGGTYAARLRAHSGYGNVTHLYNRENGLVPEDAAVFCTIHDYMAMVLTGRRRPLVHSSDGASFGGYDLAEKRFVWTDPLQPELTDSTVTAGAWRGIPVAVAIGDNQASFLGGGCGRDTVLVNVGTGSQVSFMTDRLQAGAGLEVRPLSDGRMIMAGSSLCGGRAYALLEQFFRQTAAMAGCPAESLYGAMADAADTRRDTDLEFCTLFCGTREEPERRAAVTGLSPENFTPADLICGCLRGIGSELLDLYRAGGRACTRLVGTGNGIRKNPALRRTLEALFGMEMQTPRFCEEAAAGAALFAMTASGRCANLEEAERIVRYDI